MSSSNGAPSPDNKFSISYTEGRVKILAQFHVKHTWDFTRNIIFPALIGSGIITSFPFVLGGHTNQFPPTPSSSPVQIEQLRNP